MHVQGSLTLLVVVLAVNGQLTAVRSTNRPGTPTLTGETTHRGGTGEGDRIRRIDAGVASLYQVSVCTVYFDASEPSAVVPRSFSGTPNCGVGSPWCCGVCVNVVQRVTRHHGCFTRGWTGDLHQRVVQALSLNTFVV